MIMKYPKEYLEEIKLRLRVSQVVGKHVQLKKRGKEFIGLSPFKNEKTPSFTVNDEKGFYHCFSTGEHGNVFDFLMKVKSLRFGEAVKSLASEAGLPMYKFSKFDKEKEERYEKYKKIIIEYNEFYHSQLFEKENQDALEYLKKRELDIDTIKKFKLGFVPRNNNYFSTLLKKYTKEEIMLTGLYYLVEQKQKYVDRFNGRIIFPISNLSGDVIAFGGRILNSSNLAKYINSPETEFYKKGRQLYNLNLAKEMRTDSNEVVIVEGYMDVLSLYSKGIKNVISNSGTALTEGQINLIWKFFTNPIICLDGDESGQKAALRIAERLFPLINENSKIFFSILPKGKDPDDIIKKSGKTGFLEILKEKIIIQTYIWEKLLSDVNTNNPYEITKFEKQLRKISFTVKDETLRKYILEDFLSKISKLTPNFNLKKNFNTFKKNNFKVLNETKNIHLKKQNFSRQDLLEFSLLYISIYFSGAVREEILKLSNYNFFDKENNYLKTLLIKLNLEENNEKEIEKKITNQFPELVKKICENSNMKTVLNKKNYDQINEVFYDLLTEMKNFENNKKLESLEKKLINNMDENVYSELLKLKSQINRD